METFTRILKPFLPSLFNLCSELNSLVFVLITGKLYISSKRAIARQLLLKKSVLWQVTRVTVRVFCYATHTCWLEGNLFRPPRLTLKEKSCKFHLGKIPKVANNERIPGFEKNFEAWVEGWKHETLRSSWSLVFARAPIKAACEDVCGGHIVIEWSCALSVCILYCKKCI